MCNFSQTFVTLFQPSALDGNRSAWLVLELTSWIIVGSQLHSNTWFTHSVWLDVEEPETVICVPCCSCFMSFLLMLENTSTSLALQEILSSLSHHPARKRGGQKNPNPVVPLSVCAVAPSVLFQISGAANHCAWLHCAYLALITSVWLWILFFFPHWSVNLFLRLKRTQLSNDFFDKISMYKLTALPTESYFNFL